MVGAGNDFIVLDYRKPFYKGSLATLAREVCDRHRSVGADGLLLLERSVRADFKMRYFNSDGSEASMCGNGARCLARFAEYKGIIKKKTVFETKAGLTSAVLFSKEVELRLLPVTDSRLNINLLIGKKKSLAHSINTGVPHAIIFVSHVDTVPVPELGRLIGWHKFFKPAGTNVDFVEIISRSRIRMRTYERGVEDETLACGTGAVASACIASLVKNIKSPVTIGTRSGQDLKVYFTRVGRTFHEIKLVGEARVICEGKMYL